MAKGSVLLAYSGGLDTSCIMAWLIDEGYDVIGFMADVGQEEDFDAAREKAMKCGAKGFILEDMRREFIEELIFPAVQANAVYEDVYLLGTSLARPVIARGMMAAAAKNGCEYVSHGCTGKGNDQVRFELAFYGLKPDIKVIAPWRIPEFYNRFAGRTALLDYAASKGIPVVQTKSKPWSTDENAAHISYEAGILEDPDQTPPSEMWKLTTDPRKAPDTPEEISIEFTKGLPTKATIGGKTYTDAVELFLAVNEVGRKHGVGRIDIVENRLIGLKSRGCYEASGHHILRAAHIGLEGLTMDREVRRVRDDLAKRYSELLYYGYFYSPECNYVRACIIPSQVTVNGKVRLSLYKGNAMIIGRSSPETLYSAELASMDTVEGFSPEATSGFIETSAIRIKSYGLSQTQKGLGGVDRKEAYALNK
ncbi:argininosuccinate synthase [Meira miltonrushii]|uniref:Argininosuccinate synthase n=1 Tax=Meira miltonrushii TaxID=1280837 RepID=A0A316VM66_9BASI|nr:argininosuccinate synthase [Meira miltonrushii]PWN37493.1 argininosuccinate synthase [Meira miltonrushii]